MNVDTVVIQITTYCPLNCEQCYLSVGNEEMSLSTALSAIHTAKKLGAKAIQVTGGEPVTCSCLPNIIKKINEHNMLCIMATSGYMHSKDLYQEYKNNGLSAMCISLNSFDKEINDKTRSCYSDAYNAIQEAIQSNMQCYVNLVLTQESLYSLETTASECINLGVQGINILRRFPAFKTKESEIYTEEILEKLYNIINRYPYGFINVEKCFTQYWSFYYGVKTSCSEAGKRTIFINANGKISPCSKSREFCYNNVNDLKIDYERWSAFTDECAIIY